MIHIEDKRVLDDCMQLENFVLEHVYHGTNDFNTSKEDLGVPYYDMSYHEEGWED